jgi:hypothetical protein
MVPFLALDIQSGDTDWGHLLHPELMRQRLWTSHARSCFVLFNTPVCCPEWGTA